MRGCLLGSQHRTSGGGPAAIHPPPAPPPAASAASGTRPGRGGAAGVRPGGLPGALSAPPFARRPFKFSPARLAGGERWALPVRAGENFNAGGAGADAVPAWPLPVSLRHRPGRAPGPAAGSRSLTVHRAVEGRHGPARTGVDGRATVTLDTGRGCLAGTGGGGSWAAAGTRGGARPGTIRVDPLRRLGIRGFRVAIASRVEYPSRRHGGRPPRAGRARPGIWPRLGLAGPCQ
jgi:hypothetical protein